MDSSSAAAFPYVLGLDLGTSSLGWAVVRLGKDDAPAAIEATGVRCFEAGVEGDVEQGRDSSRAAVRRQKRLPRRQIERRARRQRKILGILQRHGLLPASSSREPVEVHSLLLKLDGELRAKFLPGGDHTSHQLLPYRLRAKALDERLELHELGRALYHLAQRRGFLSNRKTDKPDDDEDAGKVKAGIGELSEAMHASGARTLGEFFAKLNPDQEKIRRRYTHRDMYKAEFEAIWTAQAPHHPDILTSRLKRQLATALFFQRPLKSMKHLIGRCELEPTRRRAAIANPLFQRFRLLSAVNNLEVIEPTGELRKLNNDERARLISELESKGDQKFDQIRKILEFSKAKKVKGSDQILPGHEFNLERGGETKMPGDRTGSKLRAILGDQWDAYPTAKQQSILQDLLAYENPRALASRAEKVHGLSPEQANALSHVRLEQGYCRFSRKAMAKLIDIMEQGERSEEARKQAYPESFRATSALDLLPPLADAMRAVREPNLVRALERISAKRREQLLTAHLRKQGRRQSSQKPANSRRSFPVANPAICRALTELRKVVNAIIRKYGKPAKIRIELVRELKQPRKRREEISKRNRNREVDRQVAGVRIFSQRMGASNPETVDAAELYAFVAGKFGISTGRSSYEAIKNAAGAKGIQEPRPGDIEKIMLAIECGWICPYTGKSITVESLVGGNPQFDVEHIIPFAVSLDNTFINKTLCHREENARKGKRTPFEAYHGDEARWAAILGRVRRFQGSASRAKLARFQMSPEDVRTLLGEDFTERHLRDTAYASRLAADYVALLYGGRSDDERVQRVQVSPGGATADLRNEWGMNGILNDGGPKTRGDHRHHAVDAVAIALTSPKTVKDLCSAAEQAAKFGRRRFAPLPPPWPTFLDDLRAKVEAIVVSYRVDRRLAGALHEETNYSKPIKGKNGKGIESEYRHVRKPIAKMTAKEVKAIVDEKVRTLVLAKLNGREPNEVFATEGNFPCFVTRDGRTIPIKRARIRKNEPVVSAGSKHRSRYVAQGWNHHMAIVEVEGVRGNTWEWHLVSRFSTHARLRDANEGDPNPSVIKRDYGPGRRLVMWVCKRDCIEMNNPDGGRSYYVIRGISDGDLTFRLLADAREGDDFKNSGERSKFRIRSAKAFQARNPRKVMVSPLGEVCPLND